MNQSLQDGVQQIDLHFLDAPEVIASYIFDTGDGLAMVDCGPTSTLSALEEGLKTFGASFSDLRHLLLTHIHFDHAGAAGVIASQVPQLKVAVHQRGAKHMHNPERLVASATQIYGDEMDRLWGEIRPIEQEQLQVLEGDAHWKVGQSEIRALYTPGHAVHHMAYHIGDQLFTGDVAGVRLTEAQTPRAPTPPPDINLELWEDSISTLRQLDARYLNLAHFGQFANTAAHWDGLQTKLKQDAEQVRQSIAAEHSQEQMIEEFTEQVNEELRTEGADLPKRFELACPPWSCVQGLVRYWTRKAVRSTER